MDFGVARKLHAEFVPWAPRTELDLSAGTPAYVSPEQASGAQELDTRTDVYSLACVVYEMLTGRTPFEGTNTQAVVSRRFVEPAPPLRDLAPDVPPQLAQAVERGMEFHPQRRTATPAQFSASVTEAASAASSPISRLSVAITRRTSRLRRFRPDGRAIPLRGIRLEALMQDFRHAVRGLRKSPGFAVVVALT